VHVITGIDQVIYSLRHNWQATAIAKLHFSKYSHLTGKLTPY